MARSEISIVAPPHPVRISFVRLKSPPGARALFLTGGGLEAQTASSAPGLQRRRLLPDTPAHFMEDSRSRSGHPGIYRRIAAPA
eukprot:4519035-Pyramimonas_sp.AAC.1